MFLIQYFHVILSMRVNFLLFLLLLINTASSYSQCVIDNSNTNYIFPSNQDIPCVQKGVFFSQVFQFFSNDTIPELGNDSIIITSVSGLPSGLSLTFNPPGGFRYGSGHACAIIEGITTASNGCYQIRFNADLYVSGVPQPFPIDVLGGLNMRLKVISQGQSCPSFCPTTSTYSLDSKFEQDCIGAIKVCEPNTISVSARNGNGFINDLPDSTCLKNNETNSAWFYFDVDSAGDVVFAISSQYTNANIDFDFIVYKTHSCDEIINNLISPIRCNYAGSVGNNVYTGLMYGETEVTSGVQDNQFLAPLQVQVGERYYVMINRFSTSGSEYGFSIDFAGTSAKFSNDTLANPVKSQLVSHKTLNPQSIRFTLNGSLNCSNASTNPSDYSIIGPSVINIDSIAINCPQNTPVTNIDVFYSGTFLNQENYFFKMSNSFDAIVTNPLSSCGKTHVVSDTVYPFLAHVINIDSLGFSISPITPSRNENYYSYEIYTYPESPYVFIYDEDDFSIDIINKIIQAHSAGEKEICVVAWNSLYSDTLCKTIDVLSNIYDKAIYSNFNIYPNPFSDKTTITYTLNKSSIIQLSVYDIMGRVLLQGTPEMKTIGKHEVLFSNKNAKGVMIVELSIDDNKIVKRLIKTE